MNAFGNGRIKSSDLIDKVKEIVKGFELEAVVLRRYVGDKVLAKRITAESKDLIDLKEYSEILGVFRLGGLHEI